MTKQRQTKARAVSRPAQPVAAPARQSIPAPAPPPQPRARAGYADAVALYEQGLSALQAHEYSKASTLLRSVLSGYPDEKELHERARLYLNICERQVVPRATVPSTPEERIFAATVAFNAEDYDEALAHLHAITSQDPDHDHALYMMAAILALRGDADQGVPILVRAIELNPENRVMARHDPDVEVLREFDAVRTALEAAPMATKVDRRRPPRRGR
jgi:tetratricopeptide (TPR) repeat protein